jgi:hypothetical protein
LLRKGQARLLKSLLLCGSSSLAVLSRLFQSRFFRLVTFASIQLGTIMRLLALGKLFSIVLCPEILELLETLTETFRILTQLLGAGKSTPKTTLAT